MKWYRKTCEEKEKSNESRLWCAIALLIHFGQCHCLQSIEILRATIVQLYTHMI